MVFFDSLIPMPYLAEPDWGTIMFLDKTKTTLKKSH